VAPDPGKDTEPVARILIVEDHVLVRRLLWQILTDAGHEIVGEAEHGPDAVARLNDLEPELVTYGISTSGQSELGTIRRMLMIDPELPILICAGSAHSDQAREAVTHGARGFLVKPFGRDAVLSAVRHSLRPPAVLRHAVPGLGPYAR
jgi:two-component system, chemotaxis family, chemotaxis protein CheY